LFEKSEVPGVFWLYRGAGGRPAGNRDDRRSIPKGAREGRNQGAPARRRAMSGEPYQG